MIPESTINEKRDQIKILEQEIKILSQNSDSVDVYLYGDKAYMLEKANEIGLTSMQTEKFVYACYEVKITLEIDENGETEIIAVDDRNLEKP